MKSTAKNAALAVNIHASEPEVSSAGAFFTGKVTMVEGDRVAVNEKGLSRPASVAASCLVAPEPGDEVLCAPLPDGRVFVLAVLVREKRSARLSFPHGAELEAGAPLRISSRTALSLCAPESSLSAVNLSVEAAKVEAKAGLCSLLAGTFRTAGERMETSFAKFFARLGSSRRIVVDHDDTQAGSSRLAVSKSAVVQAESVHQTASEVVRIDAKQVHLS